ncbi:MAG: hypothetical protein AB1522_04415 [Chloroflexota bacterium]
MSQKMLHYLCQFTDDPDFYDIVGEFVIPEYERSLKELWTIEPLIVENYIKKGENDDLRLAALVFFAIKKGIKPVEKRPLRG